MKCHMNLKPAITEISPIEIIHWTRSRKRKLKTIGQMLEYKRPHKSNTEIEFINRFITKPLKKAGHTIHADEFNNFWIHIGSTPQTLFSCHTDTVHHKPGKQKLAYDAHLNHLFLKDRNAGGECLGADDGAGVYIMMEMIEAGVPGTYVFHRAEERGCMGSRFISDYNDLEPQGDEELDLAPYHRAIAFDRKGYGDVIDDQMGPCCSSAFAGSLAAQLNDSMNLHQHWKPAPGVFTDTAEYVSHVAECTNLSVGYFHQHTSREYQDVSFLIGMAERLVHIEWDNLPTLRTPQSNDSWIVGNTVTWSETTWMDRIRGRADPRQKEIFPPATRDRLERIDELHDSIEYTYEDFLVLCETEPEEAAELLWSYYQLYPFTEGEEDNAY